MTTNSEKVASNDDLITEILLDVPVSSLIGFKSVSKHWLSRITGPHLSHLRPSGLFIPNFIHETHPKYSYIHLNSEEPPSPSRTITFPSPTSPDGMKILQSCNGLLLCTSSISSLCNYYVHNPTTRQSTTIPLPLQLTGKFGNKLTYGTVLAFNPSRSPHYKLVLAHWLGGDKYEMGVYSSETQLWRSVCGDQPLKIPFSINFSNGVYLNGAVYWMSFSHTSIYLKIDEERIETMPMPPIPNYNRYIYFGESSGRLHLITANDNDASPVFDVYEMKKDCSKWCVRYQFELREVYWIEIMGIVRGELREEDSFMVFKTLVDGFFRFMKYKFADKTLKMLFETEDLGLGRGAGQPSSSQTIISNVFSQSNAFEFIQSISPV